MATNADACLSSAARGLRPREEKLVDVLVERFRMEVPALWEGEDTASVAFLLSEHVTRWLDILERGLDVTGVGAPPVAVERARRFAQRGGQMSELLHGYRLGLAGILQWTLEGVVRGAKDPELISAAAVKVSVMGFEFNDRIAKQVVAAYQEERQRLLQ
ncbi:hypothetical protein [Streptomyces sp. NPDC046862]|uniref:hypothetical protein n=1 Tax=Streptomyces sp. NPDC046862 TaxID=3154603 RepID=UPI003454D54F